MVRNRMSGPRSVVAYMCISEDRCRKSKYQTDGLEENQKKKKRTVLAGSCSLHRVDHRWRRLSIHPGSLRHGVIRGAGHFRNLPSMWRSGCRGCCWGKWNRCCWVLHAVLVNGVCGGRWRGGHILSLHLRHIWMNGGQAVELARRLPVTYRRCW